MASSAQAPDATPAERRRSRRRKEARRAILDATEALLVEDGYEAFSMRRLAARCGYTAPTIYHYFRDKQGLLDAVVEERFALVLAGLRRVRRRADPAETVRAMLLQFVRFGIANPDHHRLLSLPRPEDAPPPPSAEETRVLFEAPLAELVEAGRLVTRDLDEAAQFLWAVSNGLVALRISRPHFEWSPQLVEFSVDAALRGLVRSAPSRGNGARRGVRS